MDLFADERRETSTTSTAVGSNSVVPNKKSPYSCKGWSLEDLLKKGKKFVEIPRVNALQSPDVLSKCIDEYEIKGIPMIIEGWHNHPQWPKNLFSVDWLLKHGPQSISSLSCLKSLAPLIL